MNDPLTSSAVNYFYWSRHMISDEKIQKPSASLERVISKLPGEVPDHPVYEDLPLARHHSSESCRKSIFQDPLASALCSEKNMNVLLILLESFRAADMDSFGSELGLTPNFGKWKQKGIFFNNFYANGFQTRHAEIAAYCSVMPNYGESCLLYTSPSPRDRSVSRMPSSA